MKPSLADGDRGVTLHSESDSTASETNCGSLRGNTNCCAKRINTHPGAMHGQKPFQPLNAQCTGMSHQLVVQQRFYFRGFDVPCCLITLILSYYDFFFLCHFGVLVLYVAPCSWTSIVSFHQILFQLFMIEMLKAYLKLDM